MADNLRDRVRVNLAALDEAQSHAHMPRLSVALFHANCDKLALHGFFARKIVPDGV